MDLTTTYMGLKLRNPLVHSSSPLTQSLDGFRRLEDAGAAAIVMHSLFEEQIRFEAEELDHYLSYGTESFAEALSYFPNMESYNVGPEAYLDLIRQAKAAVGVPVIGSLNGVSTGGWTKYARMIQEAGADALELNVYYIPTDARMTGAQVEQLYLDLIREVKGSVSIPVAVKLGPHFSAMANMARQLDEAGADGLVLFNRFYQPDLDLENLDVQPNLVLSTSDELRLRLRWVAILCGQVEADLAVTGGVHKAEDVLNSMMAGAKVAMTTSALLMRGIGYLRRVLGDLQQWMEAHEYESIVQMQGSMSRKAVANPAAFERANYMKVLRSFQPDASGMSV